MHAIWSNTIITINVTIIITLLKGPHNALHKINIHRFISAFIIDPSGHLLHVFFPCFIVVRNDLITLIVEIIDANAFFNFIFIFDLQSCFCLVFNRKSMTVPPPNSWHFISSHRPIACNHIFDKRN